MEALFIMKINDDNCLNCIYYEQYLKECYYFYDNESETTNDCYQNIENVKVNDLENL